MRKLGRTGLCAAALALGLAPLASLHASGGDDIEDAIDDFEDDIEEPEIDEPEVEEPEVEEPEVEQPEVEEPEAEEPESEVDSIDETEAEPDDIGETADEQQDEAEDSAEDIDESEGDDSDAEDIEDESDEEASDDDVADDGSDEDSQDDDSPGDDDPEDDNSADDDPTGTGTEDSGGPVSTTDADAADDWASSIAQSQDAELDFDGNPVRRGEIVALDLSDEAGDFLLRQGFVTLEVNRLDGLDAEVTVLRVPDDATADEGLALARAGDPAGVYDFGHYYASPYEPSTGRSSGGARNAPLTPVMGDLRVGLIDTAITRAELPQRVGVESRGFGRPGARSEGEHGTAVASILVSSGAGELVVANVFDNDGRHDFTSAQTIGSALSWMLEQHVDVVNISLAGPRNAVLDALVHRAVARGTVIVAAAGNGGPTAPPAYPAALPDVVAVTAVDAAQRVYRYANHGDYVRMATYGVRVPVALHGDRSLVFTGTSFAAPRIAARISACIDGGSSREACIRQLERSARDLGEPGRDEVYGFGFVE